MSKTSETSKTSKTSKTSRTNKTSKTCKTISQVSYLMSTAAGDESGLWEVDLGSHGAAGSRAPLDELVVFHKDVGDQELKLQG